MLYLIEILHQTTTHGCYNLWKFQLYLIEILHQTTTLLLILPLALRLYLIEILHQTTTVMASESQSRGCILSKFYIKPQLCRSAFPRLLVVSYRNSTSNHNVRLKLPFEPFVVSYRNSTSNHNNDAVSMTGVSVVSYRNSTSNHNGDFLGYMPRPVVSYRNSTSNHNSPTTSHFAVLLYLIEILHQTTTTAQRMTST